MESRGRWVNLAVSKIGISAVRGIRASVTLPDVAMFAVWNKRGDRSHLKPAGAEGILNRPIAAGGTSFAQ